MIKPSRVFLITLLVIAAISQFASDIYIPSLPSIAHDFGVKLSVIEMTIFTFTLGFSLGSFIYGTLSDSYGRKIVLLMGLCIAIIGSILCMVATSITMLLYGRLIQGLGFSSSAIIRAMLRDVIHDRTQLAKTGSILGMLYGACTAFAPIIGGYIQRYAFWRLNFIVLGVYTLILLLFCSFKLRETNVTKVPFKFKRLFSVYYEVFTNKVFISYNIIAAFTFAGVVAYTTISAYFLEVKIGLSPEFFGYTALINSGSLVLGGFCNVKMVIKNGINKMLRFGATLFIIAGIILSVSGEFNLINAWLILLPSAFFFFACGFIFANSNAGAISLFGEKAGTAGAVYSFLQILGGAFGSWVVAAINYKNQFSLGLLFACIGIICMILTINLSKYHH